MRIYTKNSVSKSPFHIFLYKFANNPCGDSPSPSMLQSHHDKQDKNPEVVPPPQEPFRPPHGACPAQHIQSNPIEHCRPAYTCFRSLLSAAQYLLQHLQQSNRQLPTRRKRTLQRHRRLPPQRRHRLAHRCP